MYFKYHCGKEIIKVFRWTETNQFNKTVSVDSGKKSFTRSLKEDENGEFFTWNKHKIYTKDFIRMTMDELRDNLVHGKYSVNSDDLCIAIDTDGPRNVQLAIPNNLLYGNPEDELLTICNVEEAFNRKVLQNYKLRVSFIDRYDDKRYRDFYTSDLFSMIQSGVVLIKDSLNNEENEDNTEIEEDDIDVLAKSINTKINDKMEKYRRFQELGVIPNISVGEAIAIGMSKALRIVNREVKMYKLYNEVEWERRRLLSK